MKNHYKTLNLQEDATSEEIEKSWKELSKKYHPDKQGGDNTKQIDINNAHDILGDIEKRKEYDKIGDTKQISCDIEEMAAEIIKKAFIEVIKKKFDKDDLFIKTHTLICLKLQEIIQEKIKLHESIYKLEDRIDKLVEIRDIKLKDNMDILRVAFSEEIASLYKLIANSGMSKLNLDIAIHECSIEILNNIYPQEPEQEEEYMSEWDHITRNIAKFQ